MDLSGVERAKRIALGDYGLSARDALHLAVIEGEGVTNSSKGQSQSIAQRAATHASCMRAGARWVMRSTR